MNVVRTQAMQKFFKEASNDALIAFYNEYMGNIKSIDKIIEENICSTAPLSQVCIMIYKVSAKVFYEYVDLIAVEMIKRGIEVPHGV